VNLENENQKNIKNLISLEDAKNYEKLVVAQENHYLSCGFLLRFVFTLCSKLNQECGFTFHISLSFVLDFGTHFGTDSY